MPWLDTGIESTIKSLTDMPWLDTGVESGISRLQTCPGWIQESNLEPQKVDGLSLLTGYLRKIFRDWLN